MSVAVDDEEKQRIFLTLVESLEEGEPLPVDLLLTYLRHPMDSIRKLAVQVMESSDPAAAIPALLEAASDPNIEVRLLAAEVLRSFRDPAAGELLVEGLRASAPETRLAAVMALREQRSPLATAALLRTIDDPNPEVRRETVIALASYRSNDFLPALRAALRDHSAIVRQVAVAAVAEFTKAPVVDDLVAAAHDDDWRVRREAVKNLDRFSGRVSQAALEVALGDSAWQVVREAALSLSRAGSVGNERVAALLSHELPDVRMAAATCLGESHDSGWINRLKLLLNDRDTEVRKSVSRAIDRLKVEMANSDENNNSLTCIGPWRNASARRRNYPHRHRNTGYHHQLRSWRTGCAGTTTLGEIPAYTREVQGCSLRNQLAESSDRRTA